MSFSMKDFYQLKKNLKKDFSSCRKIKVELMQFAVENPSFYLCDLLAIQNQVGRNTYFSK